MLIYVTKNKKNLKNFSFYIFSRLWGLEGYSGESLEKK